MKNNISRSFLIGIIYSLVLFFINYLVICIIFFFGEDVLRGFLGAVAMTWAAELEISIIIFSLLFTIPFLILNSIVILVTKDKIRKIGLLFGYLLSILIFMLVFIYSGYGFYLQDSKILHFHGQVLELGAKQAITFNLCTKGPNQYEKDFCLQELAMQNNDILICDKIKEKLNEESMITKDDCIYSVAVKNNDPSICDKMNFKISSISKDTCYWNSIPLFDEFQCEDNLCSNILSSNPNLDLYKKWCPVFQDNNYKKLCDYVLNSNL